MPLAMAAPGMQAAPETGNPDPLMWNDRYHRPDYLFGTEPAQFLRDQAHWLAPGARVLSVADGEGRNAVHLAGLGHRVTAFDGAERAVAKARALAQARGVSVDFHVSPIEAWDWGAAPFDAVLAVFIQFADPALRARIFAGMAQALCPGGLVLLHGYRVEQLGYSSGGPRQAENLYTPDLLAAAFPGFDILRLAAYEADLDEGEGHRGRAALIDLVARKPG